jgi:hypothetical protein
MEQRAGDLHERNQALEAELSAARARVQELEGQRRPRSPEERRRDHRTVALLLLAFVLLLFVPQCFKVLR